MRMNVSSCAFSASEKNIQQCFGVPEKAKGRYAGTTQQQVINVPLI